MGTIEKNLTEKKQWNNYESLKTNDTGVNQMLKRVSEWEKTLKTTDREAHRWMRENGDRVMKKITKHSTKLGKQNGRLFLDALGFDKERQLGNGLTEHEMVVRSLGLCPTNPVLDFFPEADKLTVSYKGQDVNVKLKMPPYLGLPTETKSHMPTAVQLMKSHILPEIENQENIDLPNPIVLEFGQHGGRWTMQDKTGKTFVCTPHRVFRADAPLKDKGSEMDTFRANCAKATTSYYKLMRYLQSAEFENEQAEIKQFVDLVITQKFVGEKSWKEQISLLKKNSEPKIKQAIARVEQEHSNDIAMVKEWGITNGLPGFRDMVKVPEFVNTLEDSDGHEVTETFNDLFVGQLNHTIHTENGATAEAYQMWKNGETSHFEYNPENPTVTKYSKEGHKKETTKMNLRKKDGKVITEQTEYFNEKEERECGKVYVAEGRREKVLGDGTTVNYYYNATQLGRLGWQRATVQFAQVAHPGGGREDITFDLMTREPETTIRYNIGGQVTGWTNHASGETITLDGEGGKDQYLQVNPTSGRLLQQLKYDFQGKVTVLKTLNDNNERVLECLSPKFLGQVFYTENKTTGENKLNANYDRPGAEPAWVGTIAQMRKSTNKPNMTTDEYFELVGTMLNTDEKMAAFMQLFMQYTDLNQNGKPGSLTYKEMNAEGQYSDDNHKWQTAEVTAERLLTVKNQNQKTTGDLWEMMNGESPSKLKDGTRMLGNCNAYASIAHKMLTAQGKNPIIVSIPGHAFTLWFTHNKDGKVRANTLGTYGLDVGGNMIKANDGGAEGAWYETVEDAMGAVLNKYTKPGPSGSPLPTAVEAYKTEAILKQHDPNTGDVQKPLTMVDVWTAAKPMTYNPEKGDYVPLNMNMVESAARNPEAGGLPLKEDTEREKKKNVFEAMNQVKDLIATLDLKADPADGEKIGMILVQHGLATLDQRGVTLVLQQMMSKTTNGALMANIVLAINARLQRVNLTLGDFTQMEPMYSAAEKGHYLSFGLLARRMITEKQMGENDLTEINAKVMTLLEKTDDKSLVRAAMLLNVLDKVYDLNSDAGFGAHLEGLKTTLKQRKPGQDLYAIVRGGIIKNEKALQG